MTILILTN